MGKRQQGKEGICGIRITSSVSVKVNKNVSASETHNLKFNFNAYPVILEEFLGAIGI